MNVAFIPVRGGSKSIPFKNIKEICGKPLVYWVVKAACGCKYIDKVYVATDSEKIKECVEKLVKEEEILKKVEVIGRSKESATDTASTEYAMLEFAKEIDFDNIVLIQATSPLLESEDLDKGFEIFEEDGVDSVLSAVRQKRFCWGRDKNGYAHAVNYDVFNRPRRQEFEGYLVENGAFYISSKKKLLQSKNRVSGNIKIIEMKEDSFFEIDEPADWLIIEALMKKRNSELSDKKKKIKMFLTDCDGCLTDGGMYYSEFGDELKKFNTKDGMGFALLKRKGIITGIITSENVDLNRRRAEKLGLDVYETGCNNKMATVKKLCKEYNISLAEVAYVGDDINDLEVIENVGYSYCPQDAVDQIKAAAKYTTIAKGGEGVIREIVNEIL